MSNNQTSQSAQQPWFLRARWPYVIIAVVSLVLYAVTITYGFSPLDEYWLITKEKETLSSFANLPALFVESPTLGMYYRPMLSVSFMIDMVAGGGSTMAFHIDNVLLHMCSVLLLFHFLRRLDLSPALAFFATLIFTVHPLHAHAVAWVPGRNDLLLACFLLSSCIFLIGFLQTGKWYKLALHILFFFLCLLTKESSILLPLIYAMIFFMYGKETNRGAMIVSASVWIAGVAGFYFIRASIVHFTPVVVDVDTGLRVTSLFSTFFVYTGKAMLPVQQSVMPVLTNTVVWPFVVVVVVVCALFVKYGVRNRSIALLGLIWFCVLIAIPVYLGMANGTGECYEHRTYTPMIGLFLLLTQLKLNVSLNTAKILAAAIIIIFAAKTAMRLPVYTNEFTYAYAGATEVPESGQFHFLLGVEYQKRNSPTHALREYDQAILIDSANAEYFWRRAEIKEQMRDYENALQDADRSLMMDRGLTNVFLIRSRAWYGLKDYRKAQFNLDTAKWLGAPVPLGFEDSVTTAFKNIGLPF